MDRNRIIRLCNDSNALTGPLLTHTTRFNILLSAMTSIPLMTRDDYVFWLDKLGEIGETLITIGHDFESLGEFHKETMQVIQELVRELENEP